MILILSQIMKNYISSLYQWVIYYQLAIDGLRQSSTAEGYDISTGLLLQHSGIFGKSNLI